MRSPILPAAPYGGGSKRWRLLEFSKAKRANPLDYEPDAISLDDTNIHFVNISKDSNPRESLQMYARNRRANGPCSVPPGTLSEEGKNVFIRYE